MSPLPSPRKSRRPSVVLLSVRLLAIYEVYTRWQVIQQGCSLGKPIFSYHSLNKYELGS